MRRTNVKRWRLILLGSMLAAVLGLLLIDRYEQSRLAAQGLAQEKPPQTQDQVNSIMRGTSGGREPIAWLQECIKWIVEEVCFWLQPSGSKFTREHYERIRFGMTPAEVRAVMGCQPDAIPPEPYEFETVAQELAAGQGGSPLCECRVNGDTLIDVMYEGDKATMKRIGKRAALWWKLKTKAHRWWWKLKTKILAEI